jgi:UDP-glucose 4-epimerase
MAHVFITGIAGFLGSHLADHHLALGHRVSGCDNLRGGFREHVPRAATFYQIDCCDLDAMKTAMVGIDAVIHTAAAAYEGVSMFSPTHVVRNNVYASVSTFTAAIARGVRRIVYCSSMARYGDQRAPFTETMEPRPVDPYGISKVAAEHILRCLSETHGVEWAIAVPHNIIGARQRYDDPYRNVASIMVNLMLQGRQPYIYGDGLQRRCFSPVQDILDCFVRLLFEPDTAGLVVNVGPDEGTVTIRELSERIAALIGFEALDPIHMPARPGEVEVATCSAELARTRLGYTSRVSLDRALQDTIDYVRSRGIRPFNYDIDIEILTEATPRTWSERLL